MNILSLPNTSGAYITFKKNCKVILSTYNVNESLTIQWSGGFAVNEELKEIGIDQATSANGKVYNPNYFKYGGDYCTISVNDDGVLVICVDEFSRITKED